MKKDVTTCMDGSRFSPCMQTSMSAVQTLPMAANIPVLTFLDLTHASALMALG